MADDDVHASEQRLRHVLDGMDEAFGLMDRDFRILTQNAAALRLDGRPIEEIRGRSHWDVYPGSEDSELGRLYKRALADNAPISLEHRYQFPDGRTRWLDMRAFPVPEGLAVFWRDITNRKEAEKALRQSEHRLRVAKAAARLGIHDFDVTSGFIQWDERVRELWGVGADETITFDTFLSGVHPDDRAATTAAVDRALDPAGDGTYAATFRVTSRRDGRERWIEATGAVMFDQGRAVRLIGTVLDISERKASEEKIQLLMHEVNHRAKNMLSLVDAVARQTAAHGHDDFIERFRERVQALAASQDLMIQQDWEGAPLDQLIKSQLLHFSDLVGDRIRLDGPDVEVAPKAAQTLGMALHELATNAAKYGALSNQTGGIDIAWRITGAGDLQRLEMSWTEKNGPPVAPPARNGFGSRLAKEMTERALSGTVTLEYQPAGVVWRLSCSLEAIGAVAKPATQTDTVITPSPIDNDRRDEAILVVEDDALLALDLAESLREAGYEVIGPASSVAEAIALIEARAPAIGILDINLGRETSERVADRLRQIGAPFITITGYSTSQAPKSFVEAPRLAKPVQFERLLQVLRDTLSAGA